MIFVILFILPLLTNAKIKINVNVNSNRSDINIKYAGSDDKTVTDQELNIFNATIENLKKGVGYDLGKVPDDVFLKDPTDYGDLFKKYKWHPVQRSLSVRKAEIINVLNEDIVLKTQEFINNSTADLKFKRSIYENVENSAQSSWFIDGIPNDDIYYDVGFEFGYSELKYENKWKNDSLHVSKTSIGVTEEKFIFIKPLQIVVTKLFVTKTILLIEIEYKANLVGSIIVNYAESYGNHHFWAPTIQSTMKAADINNEILTKEHVKVRCFLNPRLEIRDKITGEIIEPPKTEQQVEPNTQTNFVCNDRQKVEVTSAKQNINTT